MEGTLKVVYFMRIRFAEARRGLRHLNNQEFSSFSSLKRPMLQNPSTALKTRAIKQLLKRLAIIANSRLQDRRKVQDLCINEEKVKRAMKSDKII